MSEKNVEIVRRGYRAYENGDLSGLIDEIRSDIVTYRAPPFPDAGIYHGVDEFLQAILDWAEGFDDFVMTGKEFMDANEDQVIVRVHQDATGTQSGVAVDGDFWFVHTVRDGKWARIDMFMRKEQALEAAGLSE